MHYVDGLFTPCHLLKIFTELLILTPISSMSACSNTDFKSQRNQFFMPSLLDMLPSHDLEKYRTFSPVEPLIISFPNGSARSGVFCCLQVHLIKQSGWRLVYNNGKPAVIAQNCIKLSHPQLPCIITLIDSFSYLEVHIKTDPSISQRACPQISEEILRGIRESSLTLNYNCDEYEQPQLAFFCQCSAGNCSDTPIGTSSASAADYNRNRHIGLLLESRGWIQCSIQQESFSKITKEHGAWFGSSSAGNYSPSNNPCHHWCRPAWPLLC